MGIYANKRVIIGFILSITILVILGFYSYRNIQGFIKTRATILHTTQVLFHIEQAKSNSIKIEELMSMYLLTGDSTYLRDYANELRQATNHYQNLKTMTQDNATQQTRLDSLRSIGRKKLELHAALIKESKSPALPYLTPPQLRQNREISNNINTVINGLLDEENTLLKQRIAKSRVVMEQFQLTFFLLLGAMLLIIIGVFVIVNITLKAKVLAEQKTKRVNKDLEAFTYSVSHDLRAPLRSIIGFSQVLKEDFAHTLGKEGERLLGKVIRNAHQMGQLIDDLLDFARLGKTGLSISTIDMQVQVEEVLQEMEESNPGKKNAISVSPLSEIEGDLKMMKQVWINLISNALKYTRNNPDPKIEIGNTAQNSQTVFYVKDNGVGFDMQYYDKLFNVFQRLHSNAEFEGTGVGLALVHRIITRHHGKIWAEAKPNEGATFYFSIPK